MDMVFRGITRKKCLKQLLALLWLAALLWFCISLVKAYKTIPQVNAVPQTQLVPEFLLKDYLDETQVENEENNLGTGVKKTLIIVSHGRSGSSLVGDIFNHHPSVFYMYEPLQTVMRVFNSLNRNHINSAPSYWDLAKEFLDAVLRCKFNNQRFLSDIEDFYRKKHHPRVSQAIASPPLCPHKPSDLKWKPNLCPPMTKESLASTCRKKYDLTVLKVLISRIPENTIKIVLNACTSRDVDCKIVFLVRDPRAVIPSSKALGFFRDAAGDIAMRGTRLYSYWRCKETEENMEIIRKLDDSLRKRIKLQRYEDLALNPLKALTGLYQFAGLSELESIKTWLNETTRKTRGDCNEMDGEQATCTKDDAWVAANRWRWKVHPQEISIVEKYCKETMRLMGYTPVDMSSELLSNQSIPLFSQDYEAKQWFLH